MDYTCSYGDVEQVGGLSRELILSEGVAYFLSRLPPPDYIGLQKMSEIMGKYVVSLSHKQIVSFKAMFDFRMQHLRLIDGIENCLYEINNETMITRKLESLSVRELEIAKLAGQKLTSEEIAKRLFLSPHTINTPGRTCSENWE